MLRNGHGRITGGSIASLVLVGAFLLVALSGGAAADVGESSLEQQTLTTDGVDALGDPGDDIGPAASGGTTAGEDDGHPGNGEPRNGANNPASATGQLNRAR